MRVAIIDYGSGNLRSVAKAFERVGGDEVSVAVTSEHTDRLSAQAQVVVRRDREWSTLVLRYTDIYSRARSRSGSS